MNPRWTQLATHVRSTQSTGSSAVNLVMAIPVLHWCCKGRQARFNFMRHLYKSGPLPQNTSVLTILHSLVILLVKVIMPDPSHPVNDALVDLWHALLES